MSSRYSLMSFFLMQTRRTDGALTQQHVQAATAVEVLRVGLEVLGEVANTGGDQGNLHTGGTGVAGVLAILGDDCGLLFFGDH